LTSDVPPRRREKQIDALRIFWLREGMLSDELMREFFDTWQIKRDGAKRGIVEIQP